MTEAYTAIESGSKRVFMRPSATVPDYEYNIWNWIGVRFQASYRDWLLILDTRHRDLYISAEDTGTVTKLKITESGLPVFIDRVFQWRYGTISCEAVMDHIYTHGVPDFGPGAVVRDGDTDHVLVPGAWGQSNQPDHLQE
jgi:hypothetical protein